MSENTTPEPHSIPERVPAASGATEQVVPEPGAATIQDSFELPGAPDQFQRLWTPHRTAYVSGGQQDYTEKTCPFCTAPNRSDEESLIVKRGEHAFVILNLYPYNPGHLLVCPYRHIPLDRKSVV